MFYKILFLGFKKSTQRDYWFVAIFKGITAILIKFVTKNIANMSCEHQSVKNIEVNVFFKTSPKNRIVKNLETLHR